MTLLRLAIALLAAHLDAAVLMTGSDSSSGTGGGVRGAPLALTPTAHVRLTLAQQYRALGAVVTDDASHAMHLRRVSVEALKCAGEALFGK